MGITDTIEIFYSEKRKKYLLMQGNETHYNEDRQMREWDTAYDAACWAYKNLNRMYLSHEIRLIADNVKCKHSQKT